MEEGKEVKLGDISLMKYGKLPPKTQGYLYPIWSGYRYVGLADTFNCPKGTLIVVARGVGGTGDVKIAKENCYLTNLSISVEIDSNVCNPLYLYYKYSLSNLRYLDSGSAQSQITIDDLKRVIISLPPLSTQQKIANILSSLDDKIEVNRRINENLEAQAQALFKSWFVDFEPFKDGEFVESELGMIPKGWKVGSIYEYINVIYGAPYKSSLFNDKGIGLPLIRIRDLKTNSPQFYTPEVLPNTEYIDIGDVVAGMDAEFVPYVWLGKKGVLNQRCCKFVAKDAQISNYYILFLIKPELEFVQSYKTGTTVSHLGKTDIDNFNVIIPPYDIVLFFSEKVNSLLSRKLSLAKEISRLASLRDTLLAKLMSGEVDVNDVKI